MNDLMQRIKEVCQEIARERGDLSLLGLFQRESGIGNWDVVVSALWINRRERTADIPYLARKFWSQLKPNELKSISGVVPLHPSAPFVQTVQESVGEVDGVKEVPGFTFDGMALTRGYVLISHPDGHGTLHKEAAASQST
jgi:hypothetical protein